ncbi:MAG: DEAD/DEAH box helicase [Rhodanobacteraceae bacterium]
MRLNLVLRDYQQAAFDQARELIRQGKRRILIVAPTGAGKTVLASALMEMTAAKGNRATFVVDRLSLIGQTSEMFDRYGIEHGVIQSQHPRFRLYERVQVCSVQTLAKRGWPESQVDVFDEAHVLHACHKRRMADDSIVIGLTATPFTRGLAKYFDAVINVTTTRALIEAGWLSKYRIFSCAEPDMTGARVKSSGEWDETDASDRAVKIIGDVVAEYTTHGDGRKFICSAVDTRHVEELARQFRAAGIEVATYTYRDREDDRADTVREFRKPDSTIRGLVTVTAASRGFDVPDVSCIIMARPLRKSLAEHIQLFGRGLRIAEGKGDCLVLDHAGNCARFFDACERFFDEGQSVLDDGKKRERKVVTPKEREPVKCPQCRALHAPAPACPCCGHQYPRKQAIQHVAGSLKELIAAGAKHKLSRDVWPQICGYVRQRREGDAARRQALAIYKNMTGLWPMTDFYETPSAPISREVMGRIRNEQIRFAKSRHAA